MAFWLALFLLFISYACSDESEPSGSKSLQMQNGDGNNKEEVAKIREQLRRFLNADYSELLSEGCKFLKQIKKEKNGLIDELAKNVEQEACSNQQMNQVDKSSDLELLQIFQTKGQQILAQTKDKEANGNGQSVEKLAEFGTFMTALLAELPEGKFKKALQQPAVTGKEQLFWPSDLLALMLNNLSHFNGKKGGLEIDGNSGKISGKPKKIAENSHSPTARHPRRRLQRSANSELLPLAWALGTMGLLENNLRCIFLSCLLIAYW